MDYETNILARTLYGEANTEGLSGIEAIASVIMNRIRYAQNDQLKGLGQTIPDVCRKPFQFSCWKTAEQSHKLMTADLSKDTIFAICCRVATRAMKGLLPDIVNGATHYHSLDDHPRWASALVPCAQIGHRLFYTCL